VSSIRESIYEDLEFYFPEQFINPLSQSYWRQQKQKVLAQLNAIIDGEDHSEEIDRIDTMTRQNTKIKNFYGKESEELKYEKDFETYCIILADHANQPIKTLSVKEYFSLRKFVDEKNRNKR